jgi:hypothetical protein
MTSSSLMCGQTPDTKANATGRGVVYWHRELPPLSAEMMGEHIIEAASSRVPGTLAHRDELWDQCYEDLMAQARGRLEQEIVRLGGTCAHVLSESVDSKHDVATNEAWLHGSFTYVLYRQPARPSTE